MKDNPLYCHSCGDEFTIRPHKEPTDYCDDCAQRLTPILLAALEAMVDCDEGSQAEQEALGMAYDVIEKAKAGKA